MLDFGTSANHNDGISFPDATYFDLDGLSSYTILLGLRPRAAGWTTTRNIFSKFSSVSGWVLQTVNSAGNNRIHMAHGNGASTANAGTSTTNLVNGTSYLLVLWWNGTTFRYYVDGVSEGDIAFSQGIAANANDVVIGNGSGLATGAQVALGPVVVWPNYALTDDEIEQATGGLTIPAPGYARLFHRGTAVPGIDEIKKVDGTEEGTVSLIVDSGLDSMFMLSKVEDERQIATQLLVERAADEIAYSCKVPLHLGEKMELLDLLNVSHDALLRSSSHLGALGNPALDNYQLFDRWRRGLYTLVGRSLDVMSREVELTFIEHESAMATYLASEKEPYGTADDYPGVARMDIGGLMGERRSTTAYLEQENNLLGAISEGSFIAVVAPYVSKINHKGLLTEDATTNGIVNPFFVSGLTSWTSATAGGGSVATVNDHKAFQRDVTILAIQVIGAAASENSFRQTVAVLSADGFRRLMFVYSDDQDTNPNWRIQRSSDNRYWDEGTDAWVVADTWNGTGALGAGWDSVNGQPNLKMFWSKPIPVENNENWEVRLGKINTATTHYFYAVNLTIGRFRFMPILETTATVPDDRSSVVDVPPAFADIFNPLAEGLVAAYLFDEGTGTVIRDSSGLGHNGVVEFSGGTTNPWVTGFGIHDPGLKVQQSGPEVWVRIPHHSDFNFGAAGSGFSIAMGYAVETTNLNQFDKLISKASDDSEVDGFAIFQATLPSGGIEWQFYATVDTEAVGPNLNPGHSYDNEDYHAIGVVYDDSVEQLHQYVDTALHETKPATPNSLNFEHTENTTDIYIGRQFHAAAHRNLNAKIFWLYIWNRALSAPEMASVHEEPYAMFPSDQRQLLPVERFTVTVDFVALQDGSDLADGDNLVIWAAQIGTSGLDFYYLLYQKLAGQNVRFSFERWHDVSGVSTLDVRATRDVSIVSGTSYRITARQVGVDQELGVAPLTMRINVDGVNGADVVASALFSQHIPYSQLWGTPPPGSGFKCSNNYLAYIRIQPRVITDEEWRSA